MEIQVESFFQYMANQSDDMPLYLFDKDFAKRCPELTKDYSVPQPFAEDLFSVLGDSRPDYRWLIIGPARSGSSFHIDPNSTSAWNAAIRGRKKWCVSMFENVLTAGQQHAVYDVLLSLNQRFFYHADASA